MTLTAQCSLSELLDAVVSGRVTMGVVIIYRFLLANVLTLYYAVLAVTLLIVNYLKNPFTKQTLTLVPPAPLSDPKYGVHKYIKANNTTLHYVDSGDTTKPLMLFLHGFPEFWYSWRHQIVHFNKKYRCVAVDMRGYGDSERPEGVSSYKLEILIEDIRDLIHQLGHEKCILVAHDWGGLVACRLRDVHPHVISALVVLGSTSQEAWVDLLYSDSEQMKMSWYIFLFRMPWIPELMTQSNNLSIFERSMLVEGKSGVTQQDVQCFKYWFGKQTAMTSPINYYRANFRYSVEKKFHDEKVPFLVVHGSNEKYLSRLLLERMKDNYAVIETAILENAGHFMQQEEPENTNKLIDEFLQKHSL